MFNKLQQRWKVGPLGLLLVITTFALGGSLCGFLGKRAIQLLEIDIPAIRIGLYILIITILWPFCVLAISIPLGQFTFFKQYLQKMGKRLFNKKQHHVNAPVPLAIFASGAGSNAANIIAFSQKPENKAAFRVALVVTNKPAAGVVDIARNAGIPLLLIEKEPFFTGGTYVDHLKELGIEWIILAGFLWKVPAQLVAAFPSRIVNIHPALLPDFGGKGMYGHHVHQAVLESGKTESGITIHYVDELYDHGAVILQAKCPIVEGETVSSLAEKIHALEHRHFPNLINQLVQNAKS